MPSQRQQSFPSVRRDIVVRQAASQRTCDGLGNLFSICDVGTVLHLPAISLLLFKKKNHCLLIVLDIAKTGFQTSTLQILLVGHK
jgi:hypothetical protein